MGLGLGVAAGELLSLGARFTRGGQGWPGGSARIVAAFRDAVRLKIIT